MSFWKTIRGIWSQTKPLPEGWTDDMSIPLPDGITPAEIARLGVEHLGHDAPFDKLVEKFKGIGLTDTDAELAADRIAGGMTRAFMPNPAAAPNGDKDPIARAAYDLIRSKAG